MTLAITRYSLFAAAALLVAPAAHAHRDEIPYRIGKYPQEMAATYAVSDDDDDLDDVTQLALVDGKVVAISDEHTWFFNGEAFERTASLKPAPASPVAAPDAEDGLGRIWQGSKSKAVTKDIHGDLWFGVQAGVAHETAKGWDFIDGTDGLPYTSFTCAAAGPDGSVWFGTELGVVNWRDGNWNYRQGRRWLPDDEIRAILVDRDGGAWVATHKGIGRIYFKSMTLLEKADYYEREAERLKRTQYGYLAEGSLKTPGNLNELRQHDSDNDGLWTSMYGAGEAFAYGATGKSVYKERAKRAFEALRFLQKVTQGGEHSPPKGFVARTVYPTGGRDPNDGRAERDEQAQRHDARWKMYEPRWPKSADGQWYWKSDTSSDELDGHYFFYPIYYDLCADTDDEKDRVQDVVRELTDHLIEQGFKLVDHDGHPTRWSIYDPESVNNGADWWTERGLLSLSMLSYLTVATHITGDQKYQHEAEKLMKEHAYHTNAMNAKLQHGVGSGNQSDNEMAFMSYYNLLKYLDDDELSNMLGYSFFEYYALIEPERNPFFNFAYATQGIGRKFTTVFGSYPIPPRSTWLTESMDTLKGFPMELVDWPLQNSQRLDVVLLPWQQQGIDLYFPSTKRRGNLVGGKVLPIENRFVNQWNHDAWRLDYEGKGRMIASGTAFLLPYYMGLYHGFIQETE